VQLPVDVANFIAGNIRSNVRELEGALVRLIAYASLTGMPEIKAKNNSRQIVYPRQIAMYLAKQLTEASLPEIGRQFGGKHHTTVLHSIDKIETLRKADKDLNRLLNKLSESLSS
jgi:chromosomal replication initiator protein